MVERVWSARTASRDSAAAYAAYFRRVVLPELAAVGGYRGAKLLQRDLRGGIEIVVSTWWNSLDAIRAFADPSLAARPEVWLLLAGGAKGKRMALPNGKILIHQPSGGFEGQSTDIEIHAREILKTRARIDEIYAHHTGQPVEQIHTDMERDRFFTAEQSVEYGLIDRVIESH